MNITRFTFSILLAAIVWMDGCVTQRPTPDPLAGWQIAFKEEPNQIIEKDYQDYIRTLSPEEQKFAGPIFYLKDGTGQHAIKIKIGLNGTSWEHVLIYDKYNKRIKVIKYSTGNYAS